MKFAREMGRPLVATADVHYLRRGDHHHPPALLCVQTKSTLAAPKLSFDTNEFYLKSSEELAQSFSDLPEALAATVEIADAVTSRSGWAASCPALRDAERGAEASPARTGRRRAGPRYGDPVPAEARDRAELELGVIDSMGFNAYFLIVHDFVAFAKRSGIAVAPAAARPPARSSPTALRSPTSTRCATGCCSSAS